MKIFSLILILIASNLLISCGTKGSLYIPEEKYPQTESRIIDFNSYYYQTKIA